MNDYDLGAAQTRARRRLGATILATATFVVGVGVGVTGAKAKDDDGYRYVAGTKTTPALVSQIANEAANANRYADWCGGYVQVIGTDISVYGCDR